MLRRKDIGVLLWGTGAPLVWPENVKVKPLGNVTDSKQMATLYSASDLFVCPSRIDNLPNTILESMACGTPVVASNVGGLPDMVRAEETGWLYQPNTALACAKSLDVALQNRETWPAYGSRCRQVVESQFSPALQASRYKALYLQLLSHDSVTTTSTT
jgi:glycosyltransferase involved in cell wall biosynthesis